MEQTTVRVATIREATADDLRANLASTPVPKGTRSAQDYEHAKRVMQIWRDYLASEGIAAPSYDACVRVISDWVGV